MLKNVLILGAFAGAVVLYGMRDRLDPDPDFIRHRVERIQVISDAGDARTVGVGSGAYTWVRDLAPGSLIEIKGVNGDVTATTSPVSEVRVRVEKTSRGSDPDEVRVVAVEWDGGTTLCAVYPSTSRSRPNICAPGDGGRLSSNNNDVRVNFHVEVPEGITFVGRTTNGDVSAADLSSDARLFSTNGDIDVSTSGAAEAQTVNGDIHATMGVVRAGTQFESVNGDIVLRLPESVGARVGGASVNGSIRSDFPLNIKSGPGPKSVTGILGDGTAMLSLETVNGDLRILRRNR